MSNKKAEEIHRIFSTRNREQLARVARGIFDAFEAGATVQQLSLQHGLPTERIDAVLNDERRNRASGAKQPAS